MTSPASVGLALVFQWDTCLWGMWSSLCKQRGIFTIGGGFSNLTSRLKTSFPVTSPLLGNQEEIDKRVIEWLNVIHIFGAALRSLFDQKVGLEQELLWHFYYTFCCLSCWSNTSLFFWSSKEITEILLTSLVKQACLPTSMLIHFQLFTTPWTVSHQAPQSMGLSWQEYRSGLPFSPLGDLPNTRIKPGSPASPEFPALQVDSLSLSHQRSPVKQDSQHSLPPGPSEVLSCLYLP